MPVPLLGKSGAKLSRHPRVRRKSPRRALKPYAAQHKICVFFVVKSLVVSVYREGTLQCIGDHRVIPFAKTITVDSNDDYWSFIGRARSVYWKIAKPTEVQGKELK